MLSQSSSEVAPDADADAERKTKLVYRSVISRSSELRIKLPWVGTSAAGGDCAGVAAGRVHAVVLNERAKRARGRNTHRYDVVQAARRAQGVLSAEQRVG